MIIMMDMRTLLNRIFPTLYSLAMWHPPFISPEFMSLSPPPPPIKRQWHRPNTKMSKYLSLAYMCVVNVKEVPMLFDGHRLGCLPPFTFLPNVSTSTQFFVAFTLFEWGGVEVFLDDCLSSRIGRCWCML